MLFLAVAPCRSSGPAAAQEPAERIYLTGATVVDGVSAEALPGATVIVEGRTIASVETGAFSPPAGAEVIDIHGYHLVPGLIDAHTHVSTLAGLRRAVATGVTTVRTAGVRSYRDFAIREMVRDDRLPGPDVLAAGLYVQPDLGERVLADPRLAPLHGSGANTPEEIRTLVGINLDYGADWIKTRGTARAGLPEQDPREQIYTESQLRVVVEEAGRAGVPVMAHAHGDEGMRAAVRAGVRSIEHGTYASDETLRLMRDRGVFLVPTLVVMVGMGQEGEYDDPRLFLRKLHMGPRALETAARAYELGVPLATGADTYYTERNVATVGREVAYLIDAGVPPRNAFRAATSRGAELLGIDDLTGSIRPGLEADLLVVERDPVEHPRTLQDPLLVMSNGTVVHSRLPFTREEGR
ncbi:MAG: amidohydrolase family protein [Gemmatimonadetes bacterium]|nr:amidohydrolase family protein [Gemmatimonadota bacterium]NIV84821.1 amidohydrolase family protein [Gemmatimonadota bacterium]NIY39794.1 amidohydrolase family protein [Gemmatimonadota bacterium]